MSSSTFGSFEIGRRAIHAQQKGVQVTGQNIANANTEGYSRQVVHMKALVPPAVPGVVTPPGYGVDISDIERMKSEFYGEQIRKAITAQHYWDRLGQTMDGIESIFQEPGENSVNIYLNEFFDAWQEISVNPESYAARISLREQAVSLTGLVRDIYGRLDEFKHDVEKELETAVKQVNSIAEEIAELNEKITYLGALGKKSNELLDERDLCLQKLSEFVNIRVIERANGSVEVLAGGRLLLHDDRSFPLEMEVDKNGDGQLVASVTNSLGAELAVEGGALAGMLESYNEVLPYYQGGLNDLVSTLVEKVNEIHRQGYGLDGKGPVMVKGEGENKYIIDVSENNFFKPITGDNLGDAARFFAVEDAILEDAGRIAAATSLVEAISVELGEDGDENDSVEITIELEGEKIIGTGTIINDGNGIGIIEDEDGNKIGTIKYEDDDKRFTIEIEDVKITGTIIDEDHNKIEDISIVVSPPSTGDGSNALKIAKLREVKVFGEETTTFHDYYRGMIADLGVAGRETERMLQTIIAVSDRLIEHAEAVSGVSLDDEMINLVQYQHAYTAAARFLNTFDEMLGILLSELGR